MTFDNADDYDNNKVTDEKPSKEENKYLHRLDNDVRKAKYSSSGIYHNAVTYDRAFAAPILKWRNPRNRPMSAATVSLYGEIMLEGKGRGDTCEPIAFDWDGNIIDGQQRLQAIVNRDLVMTLYTTYGYDPETMSVLNGGRLRKSTGESNRILGRNDCEAVLRFAKLDEGRKYAHANNTALRPPKKRRLDVEIEMIKQTVELFDQIKAEVGYKKLAGVSRPMAFAVYNAIKEGTGSAAFAKKIIESLVIPSYGNEPAQIACLRQKIAEITAGVTQDKNNPRVFHYILQAAISMRNGGSKRPKFTNWSHTAKFGQLPPLPKIK